MGGCGDWSWRGLCGGGLNALSHRGTGAAGGGVVGKQAWFAVYGGEDGQRVFRPAIGAWREDGRVVGDCEATKWCLINKKESRMVLWIS
mgnify:CR=1 FL=1